MERGQLPEEKVCVKVIQVEKAKLAVEQMTKSTFRMQYFQLCSWIRKLFRVGLLCYNVWKILPD